jgi:putative hydrolase of the HAD superfamily
MIKHVSLDMDGTLINMKFVDKVWMEGVPTLYAEKHDMEFEPAKEIVVSEYMKVGSDKLEWYDLKHWLDKFELDETKEDLLERYADEIEVYPEVREALDAFSEKFNLVVTSNAARDFLDLELEEIGQYFSEVFSATSDFRQTKKFPKVYKEVCRRLEAKPLEVLHIGDHYSYDYEAALDAGLDAIFLDRNGKRTGREVVGDLREAVEQVCCSSPEILHLEETWDEVTEDEEEF